MKWLISSLVLLVACSADPFVLGVTFPEAAGVKPGDNVTVRGLAIGQVRDVDLHPAGVVVRLEVQPKFAAHLDDKATFSIEEEKLVTGKRRITVVPGGGTPLQAGATVAGHALPADMIARADKALADNIKRAEDAMDRAAKRIGRKVLGPDTLPPRTRGDTVDLDRPRHYRLELLSLKIHGTSADGKDWDSMGDPELLIQGWVDERQVLLVEAGDGLEMEFGPEASEPFDLTPKSRLSVKVLDKDVGYNDEIGVVELTPTPADAQSGRIFRLAAGRIIELRLRIQEIAP